MTVTNVERKSFGFETVINSYQFSIHRHKACCIVRKMNKTQLIWGSIYTCNWYRKISWPNTEPCGKPNIMIDIEELLFLIETYYFLFLKWDLHQLCMTPLMPLCSSLLITMSWLTECFWEIKIYSINCALFAV